MPLRSRLLGALALAGLLPGGGGADAPEAEVRAELPAVAPPRVEAPPGETRIDYALFDARLQRLMQQPKMAGLAVAVVEDGRITWARGYGETVKGSGDLVTPETVFRWASLSKGVAGTLVAMLAAEGKLRLDDPVARWAPSLRLAGGLENRATLEDVLSHRLGLPSHAYDDKLEAGEDARLLRSSMATLPLTCALAACHAYQNVAFDAASEAVEKATGRPYVEVAWERLFRPLGMKGASLSHAALHRAKHWARPHGNGATPEPVEVTTSYYRVPAAGGMNGSVLDLARWMQAQMGEHDAVVSDAVAAQVHAPRVYTPGEARRMRRFPQLSSPAYALGWRVYDYAGRRVVGHHGGVRGSLALILFDPELRTGVVALWNTANGRAFGLEVELMDMVYGLPRADWLKLDTPPQAPASPLADVPLDQLPGLPPPEPAGPAAHDSESRAQTGR